MNTPYVGAITKIDGKIFVGLWGSDLYFFSTFHGGKVIVSSDSCATWADMSNNLSDFPISTIESDGANVYVGVDGRGIWKRPLSDFSGIDNEFANNSVNISPNPATSTLNITCPPSQNISVTLFNLMGEQVMQRHFTGTKESLDISSLPSGMYIIKVSGSDWEVQRKGVKQ